MLFHLSIPHAVHAMRMDRDGAVASVVTGRVESLEAVLGKLRQRTAGLVVSNGRGDDGSTVLIIGGR